MQKKKKIQAAIVVQAETRLAKNSLVTTVDDLPLPDIRAQTHVIIDPPNRIAEDPHDRHSKQARPAEPCRWPTKTGDQARHDLPLPKLAQQLPLQDSPTTYKDKLFSLSIFFSFDYLLPFLSLSIFNNLFMGVLKREEDG